MWEISDICYENEIDPDYNLLLESLAYQSQKLFFPNDTILWSLDLNAAGLSSLIAASNDKDLINILNNTADDIYDYFSWLYGIPRGAIKKLFVTYINTPDRKNTFKEFYELLNVTFPDFTNFIEVAYNFLENTNQIEIMGEDVEITPKNAMSKITTGLFSEYFLILIDLLLTRKDMNVRIYKINKDEVIFTTNYSAFLDNKLPDVVDSLKLKALDIYNKNNYTFNLVPKLKLKIISFF